MRFESLKDFVVARQFPDFQLLEGVDTPDGGCYIVGWYVSKPQVVAGASDDASLLPKTAFRVHGIDVVIHVLTDPVYRNFLCIGQDALGEPALYSSGVVFAPSPGELDQWAMSVARAGISMMTPKRRMIAAQEIQGCDQYQATLRAMTSYINQHDHETIVASVIFNID